jgi:deoxyribodipyrimidine photo-lyase
VANRKINIFWFRRDLRLDDNIGLYNALKEEIPVICLFIFDKEILEKLKDKKDQRLTFIHDTLRDLKIQLSKYNSDLLTYHDQVNLAWKEIIQNYNVNKVFTNEDYEPYAIKRDKDIQSYLQKNDILFESYKDQCIFSKNDVLKQDGKPYTVFTPYKNKWYETLTPQDIASINSKKYLKNLLAIKKLHYPSLKEMGFESCDSLAPKRIIRSKMLKDYDQNRNLPALDATSKLGIHLRFGTISIRRCVQIARETNQTWLDELIWREFFMQILYHFPHVDGAPFKKKYEAIPWINNKEEFKKWCEGKTGYGLVDAGMRELNQTGHMHNRVRMVAASFLIKHLLIDWRWGERYFASKLLDFELSANNGNWQWVAGTGCDAAPYFRVFNPETQLKKFDTELKYVKKWVPEYDTADYPKKMIDHKFAYNRARSTYKDALN